MQKDHKSTISFPPRSSNSSAVSITASTSQSLIGTCYALQIETEKAKNALPFSHFIKLPLAFDEDFTDTMSEYRELLLLNYGDESGMDPSIVTQPHMMHLTLLTLKIFTDEDELKAKQVLEAEASTISAIIGPQGIKLHLHGLEIMNDDPQECNVLYVDIAEDEDKRKVKELSCLLIQFSASINHLSFYYFLYNWCFLSSFSLLSLPPLDLLYYTPYLFFHFYFLLFQHILKECSGLLDLSSKARE